MLILFISLADTNNFRTLQDKYSSFMEQFSKGQKMSPLLFRFVAIAASTLPYPISFPVKVIRQN